MVLRISAAQQGWQAKVSGKQPIYPSASAYRCWAGRRSDFPLRIVPMAEAGFASAGASLQPSCHAKQSRFPPRNMHPRAPNHKSETAAGTQQTRNEIWGDSGPRLKVARSRIPTMLIRQSRPARAWSSTWLEPLGSLPFAPALMIRTAAIEKTFTAKRPPPRLLPDFALTWAGHRFKSHLHRSGVISAMRE
jgi:hypothetical protein